VNPLSVRAGLRALNGSPDGRIHYLIVTWPSINKDRTITHQRTPRPAVFFDRDGTLIEDVPYLADPARLRLLPGAAEALVRVHQAGWACVLVTNQSGIGRGLITEARLHEIHAVLTRQLAEHGAALDGIFFCPHAPCNDDPTAIEHPDRKPGPGMLQRAARELDLDLPRSWIIGDHLSDMLAGKNAGCQGGILVRTGHDLTPALQTLGPDWPVANDVLAAVEMIRTASRAASAPGLVA
jgi:D-glycero-D-manno-heptose 1,7-bisphosphate phosphatase